MEQQPKGPLPPPLRGTTPLPVWSVPTTLVPDQTQSEVSPHEISQQIRAHHEEKSPLLNVITWFYIVRTVAFLYCAMTLWGAPESRNSIATMADWAELSFG